MTANDDQRDRDFMSARRQGFREALSLFRHFGDDLKGDKALSDEERDILAQACEIIEEQAP